MFKLKNSFKVRCRVLHVLLLGTCVFPVVWFLKCQNYSDEPDIFVKVRDHETLANNEVFVPPTKDAYIQGIPDRRIETTGSTHNPLIERNNHVLFHDVLKSSQNKIPSTRKEMGLIQEKQRNKTCGDRSILQGGGHAQLRVTFSDALCNDAPKLNYMAKLLPTTDGSFPKIDRIRLQAQHVPLSYINMSDNQNIQTRTKSIYLYGRRNNWYTADGSDVFKTCPITSCSVTYDQKKGKDAAAVMFINPFGFPKNPPFQRKSINQIFGLYILESPFNTRSMKQYKNYFNWTMTYRSDSIVPTPYIYFNKTRDTLPESSAQNYARGKTKMVAWFVSNCFHVRSGRQAYARELGKHVGVDIYGKCGNKKCPLSDNSRCMDMLKKDYKFYLAFENTKCKDYITEKLLKGYENNVIPIIMGPPRDFVKNILPTGSYIHVEDFESPKHLAKYLVELDKNDTLFNQYFKWKGSGCFNAVQTWCRLCALLHDQSLPAMWYEDIERWWRPDKVCIGAEKWST